MFDLKDRGLLSNCSLDIEYMTHFLMIAFNTYLLGAYMANSQSEGYNTGTTSTPFHNANAVQLSRAGQARANEWDPFGPGPGSVATAGSVAAVAPTVGTTASRKWDPFLEEEQKATPNDGPSGGSGVNDTWADIQDSQVGGKIR